MYKKKHMTKSTLRQTKGIHIEKGLNDGLSFAAIARNLINIQVQLPRK